MKWSYKTVHFELKKEGLLGSGFLDESEIEQELNEFGQRGWELVSVLEVQDGVIAFFRQPLYLEDSSSAYQLRNVEKDTEQDEKIEKVDEIATDDDLIEQAEDHVPEDHDPPLQENSAEKTSEDGSIMGAIKIE
jgi:hypothetical protein